jgi:hypothetical protein
MHRKEPASGVRDRVEARNGEQPEDVADDVEQKRQAQRDVGEVGIRRRLARQEPDAWDQQHRSGIDHRPNPHRLAVEVGRGTPGERVERKADDRGLDQDVDHELGDHVPSMAIPGDREDGSTTRPWDT